VARLAKVNVTDADLYLLKVDAVAGEGCKYERGKAMRLLVVCRAQSSAAAAETALTPLALGGWTNPTMISVAPMDADPAVIGGAAGQAARYALANGYAIIAYP
jgi:hypothetical protein